MADVVGRYTPVEIIGAGEAEAMLREVAARMEDIRPAKPAVDEALTRAYEERFRRWNGYMVDTGATEEAWTTKADHEVNAVRDAHAEYIEFGSSIYYNVFHSKALLRQTPTMRVQLSEVMLRHFVGVTRGTIG